MGEGPVHYDEDRRGLDRLQSRGEELQRSTGRTGWEDGWVQNDGGGDETVGPGIFDGSLTESVVSRTPSRLSLSRIVYVCVGESVFVVTLITVQSGTLPGPTVVPPGGLETRDGGYGGWRLCRRHGGSSTTAVRPTGLPVSSSTGRRGPTTVYSHSPCTKGTKTVSLLCNSRGGISRGLRRPGPVE